MNTRVLSASTLLAMLVGLAGARAATGPIAEEVVFENERAGVRLAGTLLLPAADGPRPGVVLITGSGPQDRDETILEHKPFLAVADHLARLGFVVLRYDDRGVGASTGDFASATTEDFAADARAGVEFLERRREVDSKRIGLVGHSEGALVAAMLAADSRHDIAFVVMMGGSGIPGEELLYLQGDRLLRTVGLSNSAVVSHRELQRTMFTVMKSEPDAAVGIARIRAELAPLLDRMSEADRRATGLTPAAVDAYTGLLRSGYRWCRFFLTYDPRVSLRRVTCPVLVLGGTKDLQVPPAENLAAIEGALREGGNTKVTVVSLPNHNHLLQQCESGLPAEYGSIQHPISSVALATLSDWIVSVAAQ